MVNIKKRDEKKVNCNISEEVSSQKCYDNSDYDNMIREHVIEEVGCRPDFWPSNTTNPKCTTMESYRAAITEHFDHLSRLNTTKTYFDPCLDIERIQVEYMEGDLESFPYGSSEYEDDADTVFIIIKSWIYGR